MAGRLTAAVIAAFAFVPVAAAQDGTPSSMTFEMAGRGIDVGVVVSDLRQATDFYGGVLGLVEAPDGNGPTAPRSSASFVAGASTITLHEIRPKPAGTERGVMNVNGFRVLAILIEGPQALAARFAKAGLPAPQLAAGGAGGQQFRFGYIADPDGNVIELVVFETGAMPGGISGFQVGLTVSDAVKAREFYGAVLGLTERPPLKLPDTLAKDTLQYMFRANTATIKLWAPPGAREMALSGIDAALGIRYVSFATNDLQRAREALVARGVTIASGADDTRLMFSDPDGNAILVIKAPSTQPR